MTRKNSSDVVLAVLVVLVFGTFALSIHSLFSTPTGHSVNARGVQAPPSSVFFTSGDCSSFDSSTECIQTSTPFARTTAIVCKASCGIGSGCHDSTGPTGGADANHCCMPASAPCDIDSECTAAGLPGTKCFVYTGASLIAASNSGPGCCFFCGDGLTHPAGLDLLNGTIDDEECDDGNTISLDGCSSTCKSEVVSGGSSIFIVKSPVVNFSDIDVIVVWTILVNASTNVSNVTVNDTLNSSLIFVGSEPASNSSFNISVGNLTNGTAFSVNLTTRRNCTENLTNTTVIMREEFVSEITISNFAVVGWFIPNGTDLFVNTTTVNFTVPGCPLIASKNDAPDSINVSSTTLLNYTIFVNFTNISNVTNVTVVDMYPPFVGFVNSSPAPDGGTNNTWSLGNLSNGTFQINITVNVSQGIGNGTVLNNTANITWQDSQDNVTYIFIVNENTTVIAPVNTVLQVTKTASSEVTNGTLLTYPITITIINETAFNVTVNDTLPINVTFVSSQPSPDMGSNLTFTLGNLSVGTFVINVTVRVNVSNLSNSSFINNSVNVTYQNITNGTRNALASVISQVVLPFAGGNPGGHVVYFTPADIRRPLPPQVQRPMPTQAPLAPTITALTFNAQDWVPAAVATVEGAGDALSPDSLKDTSISCGYSRSAGAVSFRNASVDRRFVPRGLSAMVSPFAVSCDGGELDVTLNVPGNYGDVRALRCSESGCAPADFSVHLDELTCAGVPISQIRRNDTLGARVAPESFAAPIELEKKITPSDSQIVTSFMRISFTGSDLNFDARVRPSERLIPQNPSLQLLALPVRLSVSDLSKPLPATVEVFFEPPSNYDGSNIALYALKGSELVYLGGESDMAAGVLSARFDDLRDVMENGEATLLVYAVTAPGAWQVEIPELKKVYDPGVRRAVVLVHGLGAQRNWQAFVDDFQLNKQPWQVWLYLYPPGRTVEENGRALSDLLELNSASFDEVHLIGHSLGTFVAREGVKHAVDSGHLVSQKIKKVVLMAGPGAGTPTFGAFKDVMSKIVDERSAVGLLSVHPDTAQKLASGLDLARSGGIEYVVMAGTAPYWFTQDLFAGEENDGVLSTRSAQTVGGERLSARCKDYFDFPASHMELNDIDSSRRVTESLITRDVAQTTDAAIVGFNQYVRIKIPQCSSKDTFYVVGKKLPLDAVYDPSLCSCGNGICGLGETVESCAVDCSGVSTREALCVFMVVPLSILAVLSLILVVFGVVQVYLRRRGLSRNFMISLYSVYGVALVVMAYQLLACTQRFMSLYLALVAVGVILILDFLMKFKPKLPLGGWKTPEPFVGAPRRRA